MGQAAWANSEPPLTIGRGLSAATGAIGALLAVAVLWAIVPTHAGRSIGVSVLSTLSDPGGGRPTTTVLTGTTVPTGTTMLTGTTMPSDTSTPPASGSVPIDEPADPAEVATYQIEQLAARTPNAVAVAVDGGALVITTANAVSARGTVSLLNPDGHAQTARVLFVDHQDGLAVLLPDGTHSVPSFRVATSVRSGETLRLYGEEEATAVVGADGSVSAEWSRSSMREGSPVVNQRGELVALCTGEGGRMHLLAVSHLERLRAALADSMGTLAP
jgi:hypothetical protein